MYVMNQHKKIAEQLTERLAHPYGPDSQYMVRELCHEIFNQGMRYGFESLDEALYREVFPPGLEERHEEAKRLDKALNPPALAGSITREGKRWTLRGFAAWLPLVFFIYGLVMCFIGALIAIAI